ELAVNIHLQFLGYVFRQTPRVLEYHSVVRLGLDGGRTNVGVVTMNEEIDAELDERPLMIGPPLCVTVAHLDLECRVHLLLLSPCEQILSLLEKIAGDDLPLLGVDRHGDHGMR